MTIFKNTSIKFADGPNLDAFSKQRVSNGVTVFDSQMQYDTGRLYWETVLTGSATEAHLPNESAVNLTVTADASDSAIRQTREYHRYQPGKSQQIPMTAIFGAPSSGVRKCFGYYDGENGVFFQQSATGTYDFVVRSKVTGSVVDEVFTQTAWNLDKMDGFGPSGITLDGEAGQLPIPDLQWLSIGRVRFTLDIGGMICPVHESNHSNITSVPYMTTANLPCRYEITTDGTNGGSFKTICSAVISEGGFETGRGSKFSAANGAALISVTTRRPILSVRPKALYNSITNRGLILPTGLNTFTKDKVAFFEMVWGGTLTGASYSSVNDDSIVEFDVAATAITGGISMSPFTTDKKQQGSITGSSRYPMTLDVSGAHPTSPYTDVCTIVVTSVETATSCGAALEWKEIR